MERLVDPILTDIHMEAEAASLRGRRWASRWIRAAGAVALVKALTFYGWTRFWSTQEWSRADRRALGRTLAYAAALTAAAIPLMLLPTFIRLPANRSLYLVPQALPIALPFCLFIGLIYGFRARLVSLRPRAAVLIAAILCSIASFATQEWIVPASNHASRAAAVKALAAQRGLPEMTAGELRSRLQDNRQWDRDVMQTPIYYHTRWALAAAPIVLTGWAFLLLGRLPDRGRWLLGMVAIASCVAYGSLVSAGRMATVRYTLPPMAGAWLPNTIFVAAIILLGFRSALERRTTNAEHRVQNRT
jgi:hypothetical protein